MQIKIFCGRRVMGEVRVSESARDAMLSYFLFGKEFQFNTRPEQSAPLVFRARKPDQERRYDPEWLASYGVSILGVPCDIYHLLKKGSLA